MTAMRAIRISVCLAGVAGLLVLTPMVYRSPEATYGGADGRLLALEAAAAVALLVVAAWGREATGAVLVAVVGSLWLVPELAGVSRMSEQVKTVSDTVGTALAAVLLGALVVRRGPMGDRRRLPVLVAAGAAAVACLARLLVVDPFTQVDCWRTCQHNPWFVGAGDLGGTLELVARVVLAVGVLWAGVVLLHERAGASAATGSRFELAGWVLLVGVVVSWFARPGAVSSATEDDLAVSVFVAVQLAAMGWLVAVCWEFWLRWRLESRLSHLIDLLGGRTDPELLTESLRRAVRDPGLRVAYWAPARESYVDTRGRPSTDAEPRPGERATTVAREGQLVATIAHARRVDGSRLERALAPALRLALENAQLRAAGLAELDELTRSRTRIVERAELERRRLERNLHDGAQQRVVSLALLVRVLAGDGMVDPESGRRAQALTATLVEELRRVARGIYPAVLADTGLVGAVIDLAEQSNDLAVHVGDLPEGRYPGAVETTAYLVASAGVADARERGATSATVTGACVDGTLRISVEDDAALGPDRTAIALADQVGALGGTLTTNETPGRRTLEVVLPCAS
jgi:signal transduction histidine kinase